MGELPRREERRRGFEGLGGVEGMCGFIEGAGGTAGPLFFLDLAIMTGGGGEIVGGIK